MEGSEENIHVESIRDERVKSQLILVFPFISLISVSNNIQPQWLSPMLLSQIPIKHLLEQVRSRRQEFQGLYAPLLQLINTHLPHLCLVDDWLRQEEVFTAPLSAGSPLPNIKCSPLHLQEGKFS